MKLVVKDNLAFIVSGKHAPDKRISFAVLRVPWLDVMKEHRFILIPVITELGQTFNAIESQKRTGQINGIPEQVNPILIIVMWLLPRNAIEQISQY